MSASSPNNIICNLIVKRTLIDIGSIDCSRISESVIFNRVYLSLFLFSKVERTKRRVLLNNSILFTRAVFPLIWWRYDRSNLCFLCLWWIAWYTWYSEAISNEARSEIDGAEISLRALVQLISRNDFNWLNFDRHGAIYLINCSLIEKRSLNFFAGVLSLICDEIRSVIMRGVL